MASTIWQVEASVTVVATIRQWATATPKSTAFVGPTGAELVSYGNLIAAVDNKTQEFALVGITSGDRVLLEMVPNVDHVVILLALWSCGATVVPVRAGETQDAQASLAEALEARFCLRNSKLETRGSGRIHHDRGDVLLVMTSGSTGAPKAVRHTHASVLAGCAMVAEAWDWRSDDELILALPLTHVHGLIIGLIGSLLTGARIRMFQSFDPPQIAQAALTGATMFFGVPTMYHRLVEEGREGALSHLRLCVSGSAPLDPTLAAKLAAAEVSLLERYGMTETLLTLTQSLHEQRRIGWVGEPFAGVEINIDEDGQLLVKTPAASPGFVLPSEMELPVDQHGFFATGDLVEREGKSVRIAGRRSDLIITGGVNVFPAEVEQVLVQFHGISEVAVAGRPSAKWGEEVVAFIVATKPDLDLNDVEDFARQNLRPAARPKRYVIVDEFPRTELGKVRRRDLKG